MNIITSISEWENRDFETVRWQQRWDVLKVLYRQKSEEVPKSQIKEYLNPKLILNIRALRLPLLKRS